MTQKVRSQKVCNKFVLKQHVFNYPFRTGVNGLTTVAVCLLTAISRYPKTRRRSVKYPVWHLTLTESLSALTREVTSHEVNGYRSKGDNWSVKYISSTISNKWMNDARFYVLFNSISVLWWWWAEDNETLCAIEPHERLKDLRFRRGSNSRRYRSVGQHLIFQALLSCFNSSAQHTVYAPWMV